MMNNIELNSIEDVGFTNPSFSPQWSKVDGVQEDSETPYFGQLDPDWRAKTQAVLDEQKQAMIDIEKRERANSLPKESLILVGGAVILLTVLIIYKNK
jgi:hypothetical protein